MLFGSLPKAPMSRPQFGVGALMDIPTGKFIPGKDGRYHLNSGIGAVNSVIGAQNSFKTALLMYLIMMINIRYSPPTNLVYDTEGSFTYTRLLDIIHNFSEFADMDLSDEDDLKRLFSLVQSDEIHGDEWFEAVKNDLRLRAQGKIDKKMTVPFEIGKKKIQIYPPVPVAIDSISEFKISSVEGKLVDKNAIGESGANTQFLKEAAAKAQLIRQLPNLSLSAGCCFFMVAHTGKKHDLGMFTPEENTLTHARKGASVKGATEKFQFINNNLFEIHKAPTLFNSSADRTPKYPLRESDKESNSTDLARIIMVNSRNKNGPSGLRFEIIVSQSDGIQPTLTEFHWLRDKDLQAGFGMDGGNTTYAMDLYPECKLSRTTIRKKIAEDPRLCRAINITAEMRQIQLHMPQHSEYHHITPAELYRGLKEKGYDWDELLDTRGWWTFEELESDLPKELSTLDLLRMYTGEYTPYWKQTA